MNCCSKDKHQDKHDGDHQHEETTEGKGLKFSWWWCLGLIPVALVAFFVFKIPLVWGVFLLCPLMHIFMMKDHGGHGEYGDHQEEKK